MREYWYKRPFDILLASFGILLFSPFFVLFSYLIWREDKGSIFYTQTRMGKDGKEFKILKFRSMTLDSEEVATSSIRVGEQQINVTRIGNLLRMTAMDELPQLINILKGDMSFVGPRPLLPCEIKAIHPAIASKRLSVRPGLAGLAQIRLDKFVSNHNKLKYDLKYIRVQNLWIDIRIICISMMKTLKSEWEKKIR